MCPVKRLHHELNDCAGRGTLGCLFFLIVVGVVAAIAIQAGPPYIAYRNLSDDVATEASKAGAHFYTNDALIKNILEVAQKDDVAIRREDIKVNRFAGNLVVTIDYSVPVNFFVVQRTFDFHIKATSLIGTL